MSITIKDVAKVSGVSRGTVDRVLNNRGKVNPVTEERVRRVAEQLGYVPNLAAKGLAVRKKSPVIGVVLPSEGNPFFDDVIKGIMDAQSELQDYGVRVELITMRGYNPQKQLECIEKLGAGISVLILAPISDELIATKIDNLLEQGIPTITINTDIENSKRMCYVGSDYIRGGAVACGMLAITVGVDAKFGIVTGSTKVLGHSQRIAGFRSVMKSSYPNMTPLDFAETNDDDIHAFEQTIKMLNANADMDAIFVVAGGVYGVCRAIISTGREKTVKVISFDTVQTTVDMMHEGIIKATICQKPELQGYQAVRKAFDFCISGSGPSSDRFLIDNEIMILESL